MRFKVGGGILHWKMMLFEGQNKVEFSGANYGPFFFVPNIPYQDYIDEAIYFTDDPAVVNSFKTKYDDVWTTTTGYTNYANITELVRYHDVYPIDPEMNFPPGTGLDFGTRAVKRYDAEKPGMAERVGIDAIVYRVTDRRHTDAMIRAHQRGVPVRWNAHHSSATAALRTVEPLMPSDDSEYRPTQADCPTCNGWALVNDRWVARRETVGMVCQTCGYDYGAAPEANRGE